MRWFKWLEGAVKQVGISLVPQSECWGSLKTFPFSVLMGTLLITLISTLKNARYGTKAVFSGKKKKVLPCLRKLAQLLTSTTS